MKYLLSSSIIVSLLLLKNAEARWMPPQGATWNYVLEGKVDLSKEPAEIVDIDYKTESSIITNIHNANKKVICYFSGGTLEDFRSDKSKFYEISNLVRNEYEEWAGENWLDIRKEGLKPLIKNRMQEAITKKCDALEVDNLDGWQQDEVKSWSNPLTKEDTIKFAKWLGQTAHDMGISIGLKNALFMIDDVSDYFDFAINESCATLKNPECHLYKNFLNKGKAVFGISYQNFLNHDYSKICKNINGLGISMIIKETQSLVQAGSIFNGKERCGSDFSQPFISSSSNAVASQQNAVKVSTTTVVKTTPKPITTTTTTKKHTTTTTIVNKPTITTTTTVVNKPTITTTTTVVIKPTTTTTTVVNKPTTTTTTTVVIKPTTTTTTVVNKPTITTTTTVVIKPTTTTTTTVVIKPTTTTSIESSTKIIKTTTVQPVNIDIIATTTIRAEETQPTNKVSSTEEPLVINKSSSITKSDKHEGKDNSINYNQDKYDYKDHEIQDKNEAKVHKNESSESLNEAKVKQNAVKEDSKINIKPTTSSIEIEKEPKDEIQNENNGLNQSENIINTSNQEINNIQTTNTKEDDNKQPNVSPVNNTKGVDEESNEVDSIVDSSNTGTVVTGFALTGSVVGAAGIFLLIKKNPKKYENIKRGLSRRATSVKRGASTVTRRLTSKKPKNIKDSNESLNEIENVDLNVTSNYRYNFSQNI